MTACRLLSVACAILLSGVLQARSLPAGATGRSASDARNCDAVASALRAEPVAVAAAPAADAPDARPAPTAAKQREAVAGAPSRAVAAGGGEAADEHPAASADIGMPIGKRPIYRWQSLVPGVIK
jgi:hypothetical protein